MGTGKGLPLSSISFNFFVRISSAKLGLGNRTAFEKEYWNFAVDVFVFALHISVAVFTKRDI